MKMRRQKSLQNLCGRFLEKCMEQISKEGKIEVVSEIDGVLKIRREALVAVNSLGEMMIASRHGDFPVKKEIRSQGPELFLL